jgi:ribosomal protein L12E/L44/L45/RPP1/RPP2
LKEKWNKLDDEILEAATKLHLAGKSVTKRNIASLLDKPGIKQQAKFMVLYKKQNVTWA